MALLRKGQVAGTVAETVAPEPVAPVAAAPEPVAVAPVAELVEPEPVQVAQVAAPVVEPVAPAEVPAVHVAASAPATRGPVAMKGLMFDGMKDKFFADFGTLPRIKAAQGNIFDDKERNLGQHAVIQIISWNLQYVTGPCDGDAPAELVRYSYDPKVIDDGTGDTIADWIAELKRLGHDKAACKTYGELVCVLLATQKPSDLVGEMVTVQLSPTSLKAFEGFKLQRTFKASQGLASADEAEPVQMEVEVTTAKGNTWSKFIFGAVKAA